jgi:hypothetical protein
MAKLILAIPGNLIKVIEDSRLGQFKNAAQETNLFDPVLRFNTDLKGCRDAMFLILSDERILLMGCFDEINRRF